VHDGFAIRKGRSPPASFLTENNRRQGEMIVHSSP
jgi:hypothetical protein